MTLVCAIGPDRHGATWSTLPSARCPRKQGQSGNQAGDLDYAPASGTVTLEPGQTTGHGRHHRGRRHADPSPTSTSSSRSRYPTNARMGGFWGLGFAVISNDDL